MPKQDFYCKWAGFYAGEAALKKTDAVVLVEGKTDKPFWEKIFQHAQKCVRIMAANETKTETGGKVECLKYYCFLSKRFFICIDSDYDYILQSQPERHARNFVLQTYAYAIENHYLASNVGLQDFLKRYATIIYPAFLSHLATGSQMRDFNIRKFSKDIAFTDGHNDNLEVLQKKLQAKYPNAQPIATATAAGLTADNTYLFIKAKSLRGRLQCGDDLSFSHFPMNKIIEDIAVIFAN
ncbi:MAG: DUF4435 domain-containing protein [Prevotellaceae bacterium]|jgi:hypothetical protein|nr:DUF4435 domain-containing protein [Prevotellaceae bacterium]